MEREMEREGGRQREEREGGGRKRGHYNYISYLIFKAIFFVMAELQRNVPKSQTFFILFYNLFSIKSSFWGALFL